MRRAKGLAAVATLIALAACDNDPSAAPRGFPNFEVLVPDTIGRQEPLRVVFDAPILAQTALDPSNFVVVNQCTGLQVAGTVRLSADGDTLVFSPSQALPFLTPLAVRIQNLLSVSGQQLAQPITFTRITVAPPVRDVSWALLDSPTSDAITGVAFLDRTTGYALSLSGTLYRTAGSSGFAPVFKDPNITFTSSLFATAPDSLFFVGFEAGAVGRGALFVAGGGGTAVDTVRTFDTEVFDADVRRTATGTRAIVLGSGGESVLYRVDLPARSVVVAGGLPPDPDIFLTTVALSPDGSRAIASGVGIFSHDGMGFAFRSTDGGATYTAVALPGGAQPVAPLQGSGFVDNNTALLLGDSSTALRVDVSTGAVTPLGAAEGIPQTLRSGTGDQTTYSFLRARFAPDGRTGYIVGTVTRRLAGQADVVTGIILRSTDGGQSFTQQAIAGAPDNGLSFAPVFTVQALDADFAALGGEEGLLAFRQGGTESTGEACSFTSP